MLQYFTFKQYSLLFVVVDQMGYTTESDSTKQATSTHFLPVG